MKDPKSYDLLSFVVLWLGIHQGIYPFAARIFDWKPRLSLPLRLPGPFWWIVSALVIAAAVVLLDQIDKAKKRHHPAS
ncbi:hypothetical protein GCM10023196_079230 [Actinoallomurus vinaceus]|uniref:DUF3311 domain-containing protein n=1 Tax=Actinoallomurus vinaceus TaxID=1080074 RepID=A0ABP8UPS1_9ACTN